MNDQLILLHGALGSSDQLKNLSEALENEGFSVFTLNFSGHGGAGFNDDFGIEQFAEEIHHFLNTNMLDKVDIFGYSMGGYVALWFAVNYPSRCNKIVTLGTKFDWNPDSSIAETRKLDPVKIELKVPQFAKALEQRHQPNDWKILLKRTASMMLSLGAKPILSTEKLHQISNDVLIAVGENDDMVDRTFSEHVAAELPNGAFTILEDTPHPIEKVDQNLLVELIKGFIRKGS